jgi:DNA-binding MarR family transcriptional regulator
MSHGDMSDVADAWVGLLETHKQLTRALDAELEARHGLTLSSLEVLGRLAAAAEGRMGLSAVATATGLSRSRITRICDALEDRGLVQRLRRTDDSRAVDAELTEAGSALVAVAQQTHVRHVEQRFFAHLSAQERATLAAVFSRFAPDAAPECSVPRRTRRR